MLSDSKFPHGGDLKNMFPSEQQQTELKMIVRNNLLVFTFSQVWFLLGFKTVLFLQIIPEPNDFMRHSVLLVVLKTYNILPIGLNISVKYSEICLERNILPIKANS